MATIFNGQNGCCDEAAKFVLQEIFLECILSVGVGSLEAERRRVDLGQGSGWRQEDGMCPSGYGGYDPSKERGGSEEMVWLRTRRS